METNWMSVTNKGIVTKLKLYWCLFPSIGQETLFSNSKKLLIPEYSNPIQKVYIINISFETNSSNDFMEVFLMPASSV